MRKLLAALAAIALGIVAAAAAPAEQTTKYTLVLIGAGFSDGNRRDGVAMMNMGVYPGREECDRAGGGIKVGAVTGGKDNEPVASVSYACVPLGKP